MQQTAEAVTLSKEPKFESTLGGLVSHPTRVKAYVVLFEREASPHEIAQEVGKDVNHVAYHVRKLRDLGLIELTREEPRRGAVAHYYKAVKHALSDTDEWAKLTAAERSTLTQLTLQLITADAAQSVDADLFDARVNRGLIRLPINEMDEEGFAELYEVHVELMEKTKEIVGRVANRKAAAPDRETFPVTSASMFFERPPRRSRRPV